MKLSGKIEIGWRNVVALRKCAMNDNTILFSSLLLDACIVPVSVPVCHLDSRQLQQQLQQQQQQQQPLMNNQQHQLQYQQNNPSHLAYQQANHHSYTTVTTSNQHGPMGVHNAHQQGAMQAQLQQQVSALVPRSYGTDRQTKFIFIISIIWIFIFLGLFNICYTDIDLSFD